MSRHSSGVTDEHPRGERGPTGDTGQPGDTGETGRQGVAGIQGIAAVGLIGERGQTGDHGQQGDRGQQGDTGPVGPPGPEAAVGLRGPQGEKGDEAKVHWYSLTDRRLLAIFAIVVLTGVLFIQSLSSVVSDVQDAQDDIKVNTYKIEQNAYKSCTVFNASHTRFNLVIQAGITKEQKKANPDEKVIRQLEDLKLPIQKCVKPKTLKP